MLLRNIFVEIFEHLFKISIILDWPLVTDGNFSSVLENRGILNQNGSDHLKIKKQMLLMSNQWFSSNPSGSIKSVGQTSTNSIGFLIESFNRRFFSIICQSAHRLSFVFGHWSQVPIALVLASDHSDPWVNQITINYFIFLSESDEKHY